MPFLELSFELGGLDPEQADAACTGCGALCVTLSDQGDDPILEPRTGELRLWPRTQMTALFADDLAGVALIVELARSLGLAPAALRALALADRVWEQECLRDIHATRFGRRLWVCPRHESVPDAGAVVVHLDPGLAFGTGTHPSTALCLDWLDGAPLVGCRLIDYGSGSGILAIAALRLGAGSAYAFDVDPQALIATRDNAAANGVSDRLHLCAREEDLPPECDVLVANLLSELLLQLAPGLAARVTRGGSALLAGILLGQERAVAERYCACFDMKPHAQRDGWIALHGRRH